MKIIIEKEKEIQTTPPPPKKKPYMKALRRAVEI